MASFRNHAADLKMVEDAVRPHLEAIAAFFKDPAITLLVRPRDVEGAEFVMTSEGDVDKAIEALRKVWGRK
jgi:hypothetical protein